MTSPKLVIRKGMFLIQGKVRACCNIQATVSPDLRAKLEENFMSEPLFKRAAYSSAWPDGALSIPPAIAPHLSALLKNDACPEITVKTLLAGQLHQAANMWEMMSFEFIGKLAFENFRAMCVSIEEMGHDIIFLGADQPSVDLTQFDADTAAEIRALSQTELAA